MSEEKQRRDYSMADLASAFNIPKELVKSAKKHPDCPGVNTNNSINAELFLPWFAEHRSELEALSEQTKEYYDKEHKKWSAEKARLEVQQLKGNQLDKDAVKSHWRSITAAARAMLSDVPNDYSPKFTGLTTEQANARLLELISEICSKLNSQQMDEWIEKQNVK